VGSDETDIDDAVSVIDPDYNSIFVSSDIKNDATIAQNAGA
jgi:hypothetical protein